jgi:hypothetical protein
MGSRTHNSGLSKKLFKIEKTKHDSGLYVAATNTRTKNQGVANTRWLYTQHPTQLAILNDQQALFIIFDSVVSPFFYCVPVNYLSPCLLRLSLITYRS